MTEKLDPFDVAALERALNDSASRVSTIWVSYLIFALYLLVATGTATHRQLFLGEPFKMPVLNIDLPVYWFFIVAPALFVLLHFYVLLQVLLLGRTAAAYNGAVNQAVKSPLHNASLRQRLANTLFAQIFAGSPREREGWLGGLLKAMAWITLALAPICIVLAFQFVFLPYHSHLATWTHRLLVLVEIAVAFLLWPLVLDAQKDFDWTRLRRGVKRTVTIPLRLLIAKGRRKQELRRLRLQAIPVVACLLFVAVSLSLASFPGEPHVNLFTGNSLSAVQCDRWISQKFDRLVLPRVNVVDGEKLDKIEKTTTAKGLQSYDGERTRSFRDRDLNCGTFESADLRRTDFASAALQGADLENALLQGANLGNAHLQGADLGRAHLQGADLTEAQLQGADLTEAQLQGTDLVRAQLQGARLHLAQAQGATLIGAHLQGATLDGARLQGADLYGAQLQGADLRFTLLLGADLRDSQLQGANLFGAHLHGASLDRAGLQGTNLVFAQLLGADLSNVQLQGANLFDAHLLGVDLQGTELKLTLFSSTNLWRARHSNCSGARVTNPTFDWVQQQPLQPPPEDLAFKRVFAGVKDPKKADSFSDPSDFSSIDAFVESAVATVGSDLKYQVRRRLREGLVAPIEKDDLAAMETNWRDCAVNSEKIAESEYLAQHADFLVELVCKATTGRSEIAAGITSIWVSDRPDRRDYSSRLARGLLGLDDKHCAATKEMSDETRERLRKFASATLPAN